MKPAGFASEIQFVFARSMKKDSGESSRLQHLSRIAYSIPLVINRLMHHGGVAECTPDVFHQSIGLARGGVPM